VDHYVWLCGCCPQRRVICSTHCQWQGCVNERHTDACVRGERVPSKTAVVPDRPEPRHKEQ
jgi:hypothetical protein